MAQAFIGTRGLGCGASQNQHEDDEWTNDKSFRTTRHGTKIKEDCPDILFGIRFVWHGQKLKNEQEYTSMDFALYRICAIYRFRIGENVSHLGI
jgi:hypothetical protein